MAAGPAWHALPGSRLGWGSDQYNDLCSVLSHDRAVLMPNAGLHRERQRLSRPSRSGETILHVQKGRYSEDNLGDIQEPVVSACRVFFMYQPDSVTAFRPTVSASDWKTIMDAIKAYSHNTAYRDLLGRLEHQAVLNGLIKPARHLS